jgi:hypothetical protein
MITYSLFTPPRKKISSQPSCSPSTTSSSNLHKYVGTDASYDKSKFITTSESNEESADDQFLKNSRLSVNNSKVRAYQQTTQNEKSRIPSSTHNEVDEEVEELQEEEEQDDSDDLPTSKRGRPKKKSLRQSHQPSKKSRRSTS